MKLTIEDVARLAGVSKTTVSRVINGKFDQVTEQTKQLVLKTIRQLDYRPNELAKGLKSKKTNVIAIVLSNLKNHIWTEVLEGVEDTCRSHNFQLMICNTNEDSLMEREHIRSLQMRQVDGLVVNPTGGNRLFFEKLAENGLPTVILNRKMDGIPLNHVVMNNLQGGRLAVEHLLKQGKRRIAVFVYRTEGISTWQDRVAGYKEALIGHGLSERDFRIIEFEEGKESIKDVAVRCCLGHDPPDAIFSTNNMMTLEILDGIKEAGLTVPDSIALIGYDETVWSKHLDPPLSTVRQPAYEMGKLATQTLIQLLNGKLSCKPRTITLNPSLIIRRSCGSKNETGCGDLKSYGEE